MSEMKSYQEKTPVLGQSKAAWDKLLGGINADYMMDELWTEGKRESAYRDELKFRRGGKTLITLYIREGFFKAVVILGKKERTKFEENLTGFSDAIRKIYDDTHTYHDGKWLGIDVYDTDLIDDIMKLLHIKRKPNRKK
jgi:hypothetical protein